MIIPLSRPDHFPKHSFLNQKKEMPALARFRIVISWAQRDDKAISRLPRRIKWLRPTSSFEHNTGLGSVDNRVTTRIKICRLIQLYRRAQQHCGQCFGNPFHFRCIPALFTLSRLYTNRATLSFTRRKGIDDSIDATPSIFVSLRVRKRSNSCKSLTAIRSR